MVELKSLTSPKVAIPIVGIVVLLVVGTLVAMFYVRNPTVTDGIFGASGTDETSTSSTFSMQSESGDHASQSPQQHLLQSTTTHEQGSTTTSMPAATTTTASSAPDGSTPMHAIEPVQHL